MNPILIATIGGLAAALLWGTTDWLSAKSAKRLKPLEVSFAAQVGGVIVAIMLLPFTQLILPESGLLWRLIIGNTLITLAYVVFVKALTKGLLGIVAPIGNSFPLITVGLSIIFLNLALTFTQLGALLGIIMGAVFLAYEKNHRQVSIKELHRETFLALTAAILWGVAFFVLDPVVREMSWQNVVILTQINAISLSLLLMILFNGPNPIRRMKSAVTDKVAVVTGIAGTGGITALYIGSDYANSIVIPTVLSACGPLVASVLGAVFDHERIGIVKRVGALLVVAGVIIINMAS